MMASGLVPELTAQAARQASLGAGAKVLKTYAFQLTEDDAEEIAASKPDIFLLVGGTDGGNTECILHNAQVLADIGGGISHRHCWKSHSLTAMPADSLRPGSPSVRKCYAQIRRAQH